MIQVRADLRHDTHKPGDFTEVFGGFVSFPFDETKPVSDLLREAKEQFFPMGWIQSEFGDRIKISLDLP